jgi:multicomponent Na+:H+ antiporter subunit B
MSLILVVATRLLMPLLLLFSLFLLVSGHNSPGGGFSGGLVAAAAFALHMVASGGAAHTRRVIRGEPQTLIPIGLLVATASGLIGAVRGEPFLTGVWGSLKLPGNHTFYAGTPLLFDIGVYLVVVGVTLTIILSLAEEQET